MAKFTIKPTISQDLQAITARFGAGVGSANWWSSAEEGKAVKLVGESRYGLAAAGDPIEGVVVAVESFIQDNYSIGSLVRKGYLEVTFDGLQATPGTGVLAVGDYVVTGTVVAKGTKLGGPLKVTKATAQPGASLADLVAATAAIKAGLHAWRVVSLGQAGTGAVGTVGVIERVVA